MTAIALCGTKPKDIPTTFMVSTWPHLSGLAKWETWTSFGSPEHKQAQDSFKRVSRQVRCVSLIVDILTKALMAYWNDYIHQEQFEKDIATHDPVVRHEANE
jgi:hypothetical protein